MAKLKFDRSINVRGRSDESVRVPSDEVWKGTLATRYSGSETEINGVQISGKGDSVPIFTTLGGVLKSKVLSLTLLSQVSHLKSFLNILAKEVSLA